MLERVKSAKVPGLSALHKLSSFSLTKTYSALLVHLVRIFPRYTYLPLSLNQISRPDVYERFPQDRRIR